MGTDIIYNKVSIIERHLSDFRDSQELFYPRFKAVTIA
jgi:hypothetical protein